MKEKTYYEEAIRYLDNAKDSLSKTSIEDGFYRDEKYVKQASGTAYAGLEKAAKWYLRLKGFKQEIKNKDSIIEGLAKIDGKAKKSFNDAYAILHIAAYYQDVTGVDAIKLGMKYAHDFMDLLKPYKNLLEFGNGSKLQKHRSLHKRR